MLIPAKQFLDVLKSQKLVSEQDAQRYEVDAIRRSMEIDVYLSEFTKISKLDILKVKAQLLSIPWTDVGSIPVVPQLLTLVSEPVARKYTLIPVSLEENGSRLKVAMANPFDFQVVEFLEKKTGKKIVPTLALADDITKMIDTFYTQGLSPDVVEAVKDASPQVKTIKAEDLVSVHDEAPVARIVSTILEYAMKGRASDVHIEPQETRTRIRYRIDGILQEKITLPKGIHDSLVSRIKILSDLKIDEKRIPQDGRFNFKLGDNEVDLRVSTLPTVFGEKIVMRLLKKTGGIPSLNDLGLRGPQLKILEEAILKPYGIILVTGPTGSGKSTTLYSVLSRLNQPGVNITTLEDPVEYQIAGINQVQINPTAGLTFATGLRAFLRQDPNIILVGEIRDEETTQLALQAALTGHLVFSTLHTNDAATAIPRLIDLGGEPFLIASVLNAVLGQRIVRKICEHCAAKYNAPAEIAQNIREVLGPLLPRQYAAPNTPIVLNKGGGCSECNNSGYLGRMGIYEVIKVTPAVNQMIIKQTTARDIETEAKKEGMIKMKEDGYLKALEGSTTIEEVLRVAEV